MIKRIAVAPVEILITVFLVLGVMIQMLASFFDWVWQKAWSNAGFVGVMLVLFVATQASLIGLIPTFIGSLAFGAFAGIAISKVFIATRRPKMDHVTSDSSPVVETELVPYSKWPDECYACLNEIPDDMEIRGQFVIHKGESESQTKAVPLCESCTWTYSTLVDNHDTLVEIYDERDEPTEL